MRLDNLNLKILKLTFQFCMLPIHIINYSLMHGVMPKEWKTSGLGHRRRGLDVRWCGILYNKHVMLYAMHVMLYNKHVMLYNMHVILYNMHVMLYSLDVGGLER